MITTLVAALMCAQTALAMPLFLMMSAFLAYVASRFGVYGRWTPTTEENR